MNYSPGHAWHYYHEGDNQPPLPLDQIKPCDWVKLHDGKVKPPKQLDQTIQLVREGLAEEQARYRDLVTRGAAAVSKHDIECCHMGNEALALAFALSLTHNHICYTSGHLRWLLSLIPPPATADLAKMPATDPWSVF